MRINGSLETKDEIVKTRRRRCSGKCLPARVVAVASATILVFQTICKTNATPSFSETTGRDKRNLARTIYIMSPSTKITCEELYTRTYIIIGVVYLLIAGASTVNRDVDFDYCMSVLGVLAYVFVEGAYHMREVARIFQLRPERRRWSHPDFVYHFIKAMAGSYFFGAMFGLTELMSAVQILGRLLALAGRSIFVPPS